jgi:TolB-like protein/DNA-binding winged helix-turn-helix (wHTH) protein
MLDSEGPPRHFRFGIYEMDLMDGELRKSGHRIRLQEKPFRLLVLLVERRGELVLREEIRRRLWETDTFVDFDQGLNTAVKKLRLALSDSADNPRFIETQPRKGYRFLASVEPIVSSEQASRERVPSKDSSPPASSAEPVEIAKSNRKRWRLRAALTTATTLVLAGLGIYYAKHSPPAFLLSDQIHSIAVLPLVNLTHDPSQEYLSDGLTDALIAGIARVGTLRVISRTSVMAYKGTSKHLPEIAKELHADAVLEGSLLRSGNRIRVTVKLIRAATDQTLLARNV